MSLLIRHTILKISFQKKKVSNHNIFPAILVSVLCRTSHAHDFVVEKCASCVHQNATLFFFTKVYTMYTFLQKLSAPKRE